jgi:hypothetical protein
MYSSLLFTAPQKEIPLTAGTREEISLNGEWTMVTTFKKSSSPDINAWQTVNVPFLNNHNAIGRSQFAWYRRVVMVPESWKGQAFFLLLVGARFYPHVYVNGRFIASQLDGWIPFEVELTSHITPGENFILDIRCQDWSGAFADGFTLKEGTEVGWDHLRGAPSGKIIVPIGGHFTSYGIWDDVMLLTRPHAHLYDVAIDTSVRKKTLTITGRSTSVKNIFCVEGEVLWGGKEGDGDQTSILTLPVSYLDESGRWSISVPFTSDQIQYWSPEEPNLYKLRLVLKDETTGMVIDTFKERFGFRELWAEGPDFYLNGMKRHLLASSGWPLPADQTDEEVRNALLALKTGSNVAFRLHTQPWQRKWLRIADEIGLMIIEEGALWCDSGGGYGYRNKRFWDNVWIHLAGMVRRDRNHPSLVLWSLENEILHCGASRYSDDVEEKLAELGVRVKALDPTHLITYEADLDPGGIADVIGLHYPHEMPDHADYPNTAHWLEQTVTTGTIGELLGSRGKEFYWERKKPLYIGEYLWIPYKDYSPGTVFFGDDAYRNLENYRLKAKALSWEYQTIAYRRAGVSGLCPWTISDSGGDIDTDGILYQTQKRVYEPVAAFAREFDTRFFTGELVTRSFDVFNDSTESLSLILKWSLEGVRQGESDVFSLQPAGHTIITLSIPMPKKEHISGIEFRTGLLTNGREVHSTTSVFRVFKKKPLTVPGGIKLFVYDPEERWLSQRKNIHCTRISSLKEISCCEPAKALLIIGPYALHEEKNESELPTIGIPIEGSREVRAFLENGGRIFIMEQESFGGLIPWVSLVDHASTMTFPVNMKHPLFAGLTPDACKFWRKDHYVTEKEVRRPESYGGKALLVSGGLNCLDQSPLVELPFCNGSLLLCQALVGTKYSDEPAARIILQNALSYLASRRQTGSRAVIIAEGRDTADFFDQLQRIGLAYDTVQGPLAVSDMHNTSLVILHGGGTYINQSASTLKRFITDSEKKPVLYWHRPEKESFERVMKESGFPDITITFANGPLTVLDTDHEFFRGVCREDLVFIGAYRQPIWQRGFDPDPAITDTCLNVFNTMDKGNRYEVETWEREGRYVYVSHEATMVTFATNGSVTGTIDIDESALHQVTVIAGGTFARGVWPLMSISGQGIPEAQIMLTGGEVTAYDTLLELPAGRVTLTLSFVNDFYRNGEDRNLFVDAILISRVEIDETSLHLFSLPPSIAVIDVPGGGHIVVDGIRWDTATHNSVKGRRYLSVFLGNCGAAFIAPPPQPEWIEISSFEPVGNIPHFKKSSSEIALIAAGTVTASFQCMAEGNYEVFVRGYSTPLDGIYAKVRVRIDDEDREDTEIASPVSDTFRAGLFSLKPGKHRIFVTYVNDSWKPEADRNLFLKGIGFQRKE